MKKLILALPVLALVVAGVAVANEPVPLETPALDAPSKHEKRAQRLAQRGEGLGKGGKLDEGKRAELRERVRGKIQSYVTVELSSRAGLDEKKSLQLSTAIKAHMERKQTARQQKKQELQKLKELVAAKGSDAAIKAQTKLLVDQAGKEEAVEVLVKDLERFLSPTELAKVIIALPEVMHDTKQMVREARKGKRGGGPDLDD